MRLVRRGIYSVVLLPFLCVGLVAALFVKGYALGAELHDALMDAI